MASSSGNGSGRKRSKPSGESSNSKELSLKAEEYWHLSYLQKCTELDQEQIRYAEKESECSGLRRRVHELEKLIITNKIALLKQKAQGSEKALVSYRQTLAQNLELQSLDSYIVDTETFALKHEKEL